MIIGINKDKNIRRLGFYLIKTKGKTVNTTMLMIGLYFTGIVAKMQWIKK